MYEVGLIFVWFERYLCKFNLFLYGLIDICGSLFFFVWFDLLFAVLICNERVLLYLCAFNIA